MAEFDIQEELKKLPHAPGVYIMRDEADVIMYVGKAKDLHKRVQSYFRSRMTGRGPQIEQMVRLVSRFEYMVTDSETEALVLENNLIKENRPRYNTMLKDDKTYPYIKVTLGEPYPRVQFSRLMKKDKSRYFGPYPSAAAVRETIDLINRLYGLRDCNRVLPRDIGKERPCLNYHMERCSAPCDAGAITKEAYRERVEQALTFLNGEYRAVLKTLTARMEAHAVAMEYEQAAAVRDLIASVRVIAEKQKMVDESMEDKDIVAITADNNDAVVQVLFLRDGKVIGREHYYLTHVNGNPTSALLTDFVKQFYAGTPFIPREVLLPEPIEDMEVIGEWLSTRKGSKVTFHVPKRGQKNKLMELAAQNARLVLSQDKERLKREEGRTIGAVKEIAALLKIDSLNRMEAYDISNISGFANVGSMVVYEKGKPKRSDYRKFRIRSVDGPDDYACMKEVLTRRLTHGLQEKKELDQTDGDARFGSFTRFPDLILMDGGKGQVNIALAVLKDLSVSIPVCGMVKDDRHRTRGLYFNNEEIPIDVHSEAFKLITRIQDEAHRFAIEYHRSLRSKAQTRSVLEDIPGVGPARRKALMKAFSSVDEMRGASADEIAAVSGIPLSCAKQVYGFFHEKEEVSI